jgi:hypothetical protein
LFTYDTDWELTHLQGYNIRFEVLVAVIVMPSSPVVYSDGLEELAVPNLECGRRSCMGKAVTSRLHRRKRLSVGSSQWE